MHGDNDTIILNSVTYRVVWEDNEPSSTMINNIYEYVCVGITTIETKRKVMRCQNSNNEVYNVFKNDFS